MSQQPRLLASFERPPGLIKHDYHDFVVDEQPLYNPSNSGTHTYFLLEKRGLSTLDAVHEIAQALNVGRRQIGYAGLKDARAVTRQWMSIEHIDPQRLTDLRNPRLRILHTARHGNKLRLGHLVGNAFAIKVRQTDVQRLADLQAALATLADRGVPNYFGQQRFGGRGDAWAVGRDVIRADLDSALDRLLGQPSPRDHGTVRRARQLYDKGSFAQAARAWPGMFRAERRALHLLQRPRASKKRAFLAIDKALRKFYISAYQSYLFNEVVAARLRGGLHHLHRGDLAWVHQSRAVFHVLDPNAEQPRADAFEISPSGPLFGYRMTEPDGEPAEIEARTLAAEHLTPRSFRLAGLRVKGGRRPLRFRPTQTAITLGADDDGAYLELRFALPRGCYATSLLRELFVVQQPLSGDTARTNATRDSLE